MGPEAATSLHIVAVFSVFTLVPNYTDCSLRHKSVENSSNSQHSEWSDTRN